MAVPQPCLCLSSHLNSPSFISSAMASAVPISSMALVTLAPITSSVTTVTGPSIASIPRLKGKNNYEEQRNTMQGYCQMNGTWQYMIGEIPRLLSLLKTSSKRPRNTRRTWPNGTQYATRWKAQFDPPSRSTLCPTYMACLIAP